MSFQQSNKYINLKVNGRLFPSWLSFNFKKFKLPEIFQNPDEDSCGKKTKLELKKYQLFLTSFMDYRSPHKDVLVFHGLGAGKTTTFINIYNMLYNYTPGWNVFVLLKATLKNSVWMGELKKWLAKDDYEHRYANIKFISYDSPIADRAFADAIKNSDSSKKSLYVIEEAHNFIRNVYSNISSGKGRRAQYIYDYIIQEKKDNESTRVILLSGSPAINKPFELALLFNLLRPGIFTRSEAQFNQMFISSNKSINPQYKNIFQRRIMGLVSYYYGATPDLFAKSETFYVNVEMSKYQDDVYSYYEAIEERMLRQQLAKNSKPETYMTYTRLASNFVFPPINQNVTGEGRPRPGKFKLSEKEAERIITAKQEKIDSEQKEKNIIKAINAEQYLQALNVYRNAFNEYVDKRIQMDKEANYTIFDDFKTFNEKYNNNFDDFINKEKRKSNLFEALYNSSCKMTLILFNILRSKGPVLVYSNFVLMEGLEIFRIYLRCIGINKYDEKTKGETTLKYIEYHGGIDEQMRRTNMELFNNPENKYGKNILIMLVSPAGTEGLTLLNVRQVHIMEPYWNEVRIEQMKGRAVRMCSHADLPMSERQVDIFRYMTIRRDKNKTSADIIIDKLAKNKESLIQSFYKAIKEVAIDCMLNKNVNMLVEEYKCFQFDDNSLYEPQIGPAYKEELQDDLKIDNGLNSINSSVEKIKVKKISAVIQLNEEATSYSEPQFYWLNQNTNHVYDYELYFPVGSIAVDNDNIYIKLDKSTYIINYLIPIPMIS